MATFTVSATGKTSVEVSRNLPANLSDKLWNDAVAGDSSETVTLKLPKVVAEAVHELALQQWVVKAQAAARGSLDKGKATVQAKVNQYKYGARGGSNVWVIDATEMGLTRQQVDMFVAKGATVVNIPAALTKKSA
jgi:hypothetical protein